MATTFRPGLPGLVLNVAITIVLISVPILLYRFTPVPVGVCVFFALAAFLWTLHTLKLFIAKVELSEDGIYMRGIVCRYFPWNKIVKWSYLGGVNSVYFQLEDRSVQGFDGWVIFGERNERVASLMEAKLGAPATETGVNLMLPPFLGSMIKTLAPQTFSHSDSGEKQNSSGA